jgi:Outer membrane cytochrome MtrC/MtrF-like, domains II/IV
MKRYYPILVSAIALAVTLIAISGGPRVADASTEDLTFSHEVHQDLAGCADCHAAEESMQSSDILFPVPETCANCHEEEDVRSYWGLEEDDDLAKLYHKVQPSELIFSHKFHVGAVEAECSQCHIMVDDVYSAASMDNCYTCHNNGDKVAPIASSAVMSKHTATNQCEACHSNLLNLKPKNHRVADFSRLHGKMAMNGEASRDCASCHSQSFCAECHSPSNEAASPSMIDEFYNSAYPRGEKIDDGDGLTLQMVHSLTYRYTHGFDARIQSSRCQTCHETESFCADCHRNGYDANGARIVPQSHQLAGFASSTGGKAMNRHGRLASMDIERCVTCHNVDGGDPICAMCHSTGVAGGEK